MKRRRLAALLLALDLSLLAALPEFSAKVVGVSEGDALTVLNDNAIEIVNLYGIDAPENSQPFGAEAGKFLGGLASGKTVTIRPRGADGFGDTVAEVALPDGRLPCREVVKAGFAWWDQKAAPEDKELERLQAEAKAARRGLWADPNPIPPWEWKNPVHVQQMNLSAPATQVTSPAGASGQARSAPGSAGVSPPSSNSSSDNKPVYVKPYTKKDGTKVRDYNRRPPRSRP